MGRALVLIGGLLTVASAFLIEINLAFIDNEFENLRYFESLYGKLAIVLGVALVAVAVALFVRPASARALGGAAVAIAVVALVVAVIGILDTGEFDRYERIAAEAPVPGPSRAASPFVAAFAALLGVAGGLLSRRANR